MTPSELKERVYQILDNRIRPRIDPRTLAADESATIQYAVNTALANMAILATNSSREVAVDYLYELQKKVLNGVTREMVHHNAYQCVGHFRVEIIAYREMEKMLDARAECEAILKRVQHLLETEAKEFDIEPGEEPTPSLHELISEDKPEDEEAFIKRMSEFRNTNKKKGKAQ